MKACGISLYRAAVSVVLLSLVFSGILFGLEQQVLAKANRQADVLDAQIRGRAPTPVRHHEPAVGRRAATAASTTTATTTRSATR